ncbi:hypothetical protein ACXHXG_13085 [Rhizobium sp. LEGMi198b]|uniref:hypothetical protein n=1 Tax=unclassified Rhizobium TaxID=2613769 RepID=UPI0021A4FDA1|nr:MULTISPECIES: hypothetical protein [Rhizobium]MDK4740422.1 hypothetical protein [Rhizobium sp. CNPSo 3464]UWU24564.1 hypothetical protein N2601_20645 [Rhizobium tropici]WFU05540.1 hypothetical protein QA648_20365 [Rhizobium sp. CB3171]
MRRKIENQPNEVSDLADNYGPIAIKAVLAAFSVKMPKAEKTNTAEDDFPRHPDFHGYEVD